jgi:hypothetical protein
MVHEDIVLTHGEYAESVFHGSQGVQKVGLDSKFELNLIIDFNIITEQSLVVLLPGIIFLIVPDLW